MNSGRSGRGPTSDMSPTSTFPELWQFINLDFLMNLPKVVTRGSFSCTKLCTIFFGVDDHGPELVESEMSTVSSGLSTILASATFVTRCCLRVRSTIGSQRLRRLRPTRVWLKIASPGELSFTTIAVNSMTGDRTISPRVARLDPRVSSFFGLVEEAEFESRGLHPQRRFSTIRRFLPKPP